MGDDKNYKPMAEVKGFPVRMGDHLRIYIKMTTGNETYTDFIEFAHVASGWWGNTTQVNEFVIPLTMEIFDADGKSRKVGITESRSALFEAAKKELPKEFQSCIKGTQRIVAPCRGDVEPYVGSDFDKGKPYAKYFDQYIDEVWDKYATEKTENGWTKKVAGTALTFTGPKGEKEVCPRKPTTREAFLGTGIMTGLPKFCAAINRHVLGEPEYWKDASKYYLAAPANYYAKFLHDHSINHKSYGFCYDDQNGQDTMLHSVKPAKLITTLNWD